MNAIQHHMKRAGAISLAWLVLTAASTGERVADLLDAGKPIEAFALAQQKAGEGDPEGEFALAWFYDSGDHLTADKVKAVQYYRDCAEAGLSQCQWRLGEMLDTGEGVAEDPAAAFGWMSKAVAQDNEFARVGLAVMYANGRGTAVDYGKAMQLYEAAARSGTAHGFFGIGLLYLEGQGVTPDGETAAAWFSVAALLGDEKGKAVSEGLLTGQATETLDRVAAKANAIYAEYIGPLLPATAPKAP